MKAQKAGLFIDNEQLTVVAVGPGKPVHFSIEATDNPAPLLTAELEKRGVRARRLRVGFDRKRVLVKTLELPPRGRDLEEMVAFELERHVPFQPSEIRFDFAPLRGQKDGPIRMVVAAAERGIVERALRLLTEIRRKPIALTPACHDLRSLLLRRIPTQRAVWAHRHGDRTDLLFLARGHVCLSRQVPYADGVHLAIEIQRTLPVLLWAKPDALWISGDRSAELHPPPELARLGPISSPPYRPRAAALLSSLPEAEHGTAMLALAVASGPHEPTLNLLPPEIRPWRLSRGYLVTSIIGGMTTFLCLTLLFSQSYQKQRYLERLSHEIGRLEPEAKAVEQLFAAAAEKKRLRGTLDAIRAGGAHPLPMLRELTEILPQDAWMQSLGVDSQGVEITGQAGAASQLIPLLERSPRLERVEFISPVTRSQDKEQFRIKAAWERPVPQPAAIRPLTGGHR